MDTNRFADAWAGFKGRLWKEEVNSKFSHTSGDQ